MNQHRDREPGRSGGDGAFRVDAAAIGAALANAAGASPEQAREVLAAARELRGLGIDQVAVLLQCDELALVEELCRTARAVKEGIYGNRVVLFAPLYLSNRCVNDCQYCAFRSGNTSLRRRSLSQEALAAEVGVLVGEGHKRVLLVAGEGHSAGRGLDYVLESIATIYGAGEGSDRIRRLNVNVAPLSVADFRRLGGCGVGTYQLFQETYHEPTYALVHPRGPKADYRWRLGAMDRAMAAGIDDVGIGALFGLYDWRFEALALLAHAAHLERAFGVGPHTVSVPRIEPAASAGALTAHPPAAVSDADFRRLVAVLRLALPYTGIIMSTRETPAMRAETFALGVSQASASSRTDPGGYTAVARGEAPATPGGRDSGQFQLGDHRSLDEVVGDLLALGYLPSFCTACYRAERTGRAFMSLAKPGHIKHLCGPNAWVTTLEYLLDHASDAVRRQGEAVLARTLAAIPEGPPRRELTDRLARTRRGERDLYF